MFDHHEFETNINYDECIGNQCWIVSEKYAKEISEEWTKSFNDDEGADPYSKGTHSNAILRSYDKNHFIFDFYVDSQTRHHSIYLKLPRNKVKHWVSIPQYQKYDYLFVDEVWHNHFWAGQISTFLFIDAIGMRNLIDNQEVYMLHKLDLFSAEIDRISKRYNDNFVFVSAADNIIVKANFNTKAKYPFYEPEELLKVYIEISKAMKETLNCESYGIFTQGQNIYNSKSFSFSPGSKHMNLRSLGVPFADIYSIEQTVRKNIRDEVHFPCSGYFERSFFYSLDLKHEYRSGPKYFNFKSGEYMAKSISEVISNLREPDKLLTDLRSGVR